MGVISLVWVGLICCLAALAVQIFPRAAFQAGADPAAAWFLFGFGIFLMIVSAVMTVSISKNNRCGHHLDYKRR